MLIDWFTVGAQGLNFVILVWLMKRFLYGPILHAIDAREKRIADELADADAQKAEASRERGEFQRKNEELDQQRNLLQDSLFHPQEDQSFGISGFLLLLPSDGYHYRHNRV